MRYILVLLVVLAFSCSSSQKKAPAGDAKAPEATATEKAPEPSPVVEDAAPEAPKTEEKKEAPAADEADEEVPAAINPEK